MVNFIVEEGNSTTHYFVRIQDARYPIAFFSENQDIKIVGDMKDNRNITAVGSNAQQLINEYNAENQNYRVKLRELSQKYEVAAKKAGAGAKEIKAKALNFKKDGSFVDGKQVRSCANNNSDIFVCLPGNMIKLKVEEATVIDKEK